MDGWSEHRTLALSKQAAGTCKQPRGQNKLVVGHAPAG